MLNYLRISRLSWEQDIEYWSFKIKKCVDRGNGDAKDAIIIYSYILSIL